MESAAKRNAETPREASGGLKLDVLLVRHAIAFERDARRWRDDRERPLTPDGIRKFRKVAARLADIVESPDRVLASPLVRALETASLLHEETGWPEPDECPGLEPGGTPEDVLAQLRRGKAKRVVLVGHEPDLSSLLAVCIAGERTRVSIEMKKGGVAQLGFSVAPRPGGATLRWLAPPRLLLA